MLPSTECTQARALATEAPINPGVAPPARTLMVPNGRVHVAGHVVPTDGVLVLPSLFVPLFYCRTRNSFYLSV